MRYDSLPQPHIPITSQEGHDPAILDRDPSELVPEEADSLKPGFGGKPPSAGAAPAAGGAGLVKRKEHPKYAKYFKMLAMNMPVAAVRTCVCASRAR